VALARGRPEEALADFQRSLALEPDNETVLLDTAEVYRRLNRPRRALSTLAVLEEQYGIDGPPSNVLALQGLAQEALGRPQDALDCYRRAMARGELPEGLAARMAALEKPSETGGSTAAEATPIVR
jgi:tetratricopeptide (TPR) repeat protein